jgi:DNA-binding LytR/AlgR family response regulator
MPDDIALKVDQLLSELRSLHPRVRRVAVQQGEAVRLIPTDDIVYATMSDDGNRLVIVDRKHAQFFNFSSVGDLAELLADDKRFMRVHKSFLVNLDYVTQIQTVAGGRELTFDVLEDVKIKVAQSSVKALEAYFGI